MTPTTQKWIESPEGIMAILQHGAKVAQAYQRYLAGRHHRPTLRTFSDWYAWCLRDEAARVIYLDV